jgi:hypothetical protein
MLALRVGAENQIGFKRVSFVLLVLVVSLVSMTTPASAHFLSCDSVDGAIWGG